MSEHSLSDTDNSSSIEPEGSPANFGDGGTGGNPQPDDPEPDNPQPGNPQPGNPQPGNPQPGNPQPGNPQPGNPQPGNPQPGNPQPGNPQPGNPQPGNPQPGNPQTAIPNGFLRLPAEVLLIIFRFVLDDTTPFVTRGPCCALEQEILRLSNPERIWNCYKTCRQFRGATAELLFTHVRVRYLAASIERLEKISQVQAFCRNTRVIVIEIGLHKYEGDISFADRVAATMARMPALKEIRFEDMNPQFVKGMNPQSVEDPTHPQFSKFTLYEFFRNNVLDERFNLLAEVPIAAHRANVRFDTIDIRFWRQRVNLTMFARNSPTRAALALAFGQVRNFLLATEDWDGGDDDDMIPEIVGLLGTPVLERLFIDFGRTEIDLSHLQGAARVRAYSNLRYLRIYGTYVPDPCPDLYALLARLPDNAWEVGDCRND